MGLAGYSLVGGDVNEDFTSYTCCEVPVSFVVSGPLSRALPGFWGCLVMVSQARDSSAPQAAVTPSGPV